MADIEITVDGGTTKRLLTAGKYCDRNITVTATGGGGEPEPPDDGKTRLYITIPANAMESLPPPRNQVPLYLQQSVDNGVTIDWGDGTLSETIPGTGNVNTTHTYENAGDYVISLDPADGCKLGLGEGNSTVSVVGNGILGSGNAYNITFPYSKFLKKVCIGYNVERVTTGAFDYYYCLHSISIPEGISLIDASAFRYCYSIVSVKIPSSVSNITTRAFQYCKSLKEIHMLPKTPAYLASSSLEGLPSDCIIYVPVGSLEAYQAATNWSTYADQMQEEPV